MNNIDDQSAANWAQEGLVRSVDSQLNKTEASLARGSEDNASEHLKRALQNLGRLGETLISDRLTREENDEWKLLRDKDWTMLDEKDRNRLKLLNDLALGKIKRSLDVDID